MPVPPLYALRRAAASRRGSYAIIFAVTFSILLGFAAIAIDSSYMRLVQLQAQNAADAGAHGAMVQLRLDGDEDNARAVAAELVEANVLAGQTAYVDPSDIVFGAWDYEDETFDDSATYTNAVRVNVAKAASGPNGDLDLMLGGIYHGPAATDVTANDETISALRFREVLIVQDVTPSFASEIDEARDATLAFLDYMYDNSFPGDSIGMVTFVGGAEVWTELSYVEDDYTSIASQWSTMDWCNRYYWPYTVYWGGSYAHYAPQMMNCNVGSAPAQWYYDSGTHQGAGLEAAMDIFLDDSISNPSALKTIVLVSDGKPQCVPSQTACDAARAAEGLDWADEAADNGVSIFSVSFNDTYNATQSAYMESLIRGYGTFYETPDESELPEILVEIASKIPIALVQ